MKGSALDFLDYPCEFPLKVVGKNDTQFEANVSELVQPHLKDGVNMHIKQNPSKKNTYVSITITFEAHSREQLEIIYQCLYDCPEVIMTL